jgi:Concanavalin A-like lectin/glucanases superfamily
MKSIFGSSWGINKPGGAVQLDLSHPLTLGLVACWLFNEGAGATVIDRVAGNYNGTMPASNVTRGNGRTGPAMVGNSVVNTNAITIPALSLGTSLSIEAWFSYATIAASFATFIDDTATTHGLWLAAAGGGGMVLAFEYGSATPQGTTHLVSNRWYHTVCVATPNSQTIFLNTLVDGSATNATPAASMNNLFSDSASEKFNGTLDVLRVWSRDLSLSEIEWLYSNPFEMFQVPAPVLRFWKVSGIVVPPQPASIPIFLYAGET